MRRTANVAAQMGRSLMPVMVLCLIAAPARGDTVTLKGEAYVKGPKVFLGEVAEIQGKNAPVLATVEVATAAFPGNSKRLDVALVESRIKRAGIPLSDLRVKGARSVRATTLHLEITPDMLAEGLRRAIQTEMPWDPSDATIDIVTPQHTFLVPEGAVEFRWRPSTRYHYLGQGAFRGDIYVDGLVKKTVLCKVSVEAYGDVVVAANDIPRGTPVTLADLVLETQALSTAGRGIFQDPAEVVGKVARTTIFPGQIITKRHIAPRKIVKRNQIVTVEARHGCVRVRARARAMSDGYEGDVLTCLNVESKEPFYGIVRKNALVVVE